MFKYQVMPMFHHTITLIIITQLNKELQYAFNKLTLHNQRSNVTQNPKSFHNMHKTWGSPNQNQKFSKIFELISKRNKHF
uniref:Uncharacterized protein n=1 Tax=Rhizophora mucronata TaxID=61149 RepID=A0A2P2NKM4_RHIMU